MRKFARQRGAHLGESSFAVVARVGAELPVGRHSNHEDNTAPHNHVESDQLRLETFHRRRQAGLVRSVVWHRATFVSCLGQPTAYHFPPTSLPPTALPLPAKEQIAVPQPATPARWLARRWRGAAGWCGRGTNASQTEVARCPAHPSCDTRLQLTLVNGETAGCAKALCSKDQWGDSTGAGATSATRPSCPSGTGTGSSPSPSGCAGGRPDRGAHRSYHGAGHTGHDRSCHDRSGRRDLSPRCVRHEGNHGRQ
jgi:hypothetical protein